MHVFWFYATHFSLREAVSDPEICQKHVCVFVPDPRWGNSRRSPTPPSRLEMGYPSPLSASTSLATRCLDFLPSAADQRGGQSGHAPHPVSALDLLPPPLNEKYITWQILC